MVAKPCESLLSQPAQEGWKLKAPRLGSECEACLDITQTEQWQHSALFHGSKGKRRGWRVICPPTMGCCPSGQPLFIQPSNKAPPTKLSSNHLPTYLSTHSSEYTALPRPQVTTLSILLIPPIFITELSCSRYY